MPALNFVESGQVNVTERCLKVGDSGDCFCVHTLTPVANTAHSGTLIFGPGLGLISAPREGGLSYRAFLVAMAGRGFKVITFDPPGDYERLMTKYFPKGRYMSLPGRHNAIRTKPDEVARIVSGFFDEL